MVSPLAGKLANPATLLDVDRLLAAYYSEVPDPAVLGERVFFGTSGHRGSSLERSFNRPHVLAISQAICDFRVDRGITGPLFLGIDTHALSKPASETALEVLAANGVDVFLAGDDDPFTPTPAVSHAIVSYNRGRQGSLADGIVVTPSHNPPQDGGFKYNPPHGGPASSSCTRWIQSRANSLLEARLFGVRRIAFTQAAVAPTTHRHGYGDTYVSDLAKVLDLEAIRGAGVRIGVDPLGGAGVHYWSRIAERYGLDLTVVEESVDPTFRFVPLDWDGKIRMDPSSPFVMRRLVSQKDRFDIAVACDADHDRHGVVTRGAGLLSPNQYLATITNYLFSHRPSWPNMVGVGKTIVSSEMIHRIATKLGRAVYEVPVGFKWFVEALSRGSLGLAVEESAGATFLRRDGGVWTTDKDGIIAALLSAEMVATTGQDPAALYVALENEFGSRFFGRREVTATSEQKEQLANVAFWQANLADIASATVSQIIVSAPGNGMPIDGFKVATDDGWFAARPSGTEPFIKIYAESYRSSAHLTKLLSEAQSILSRAISLN